MQKDKNTLFIVLFLVVHTLKGQLSNKSNAENLLS